jgi:ATP-binding cassette subfamily B protein
VFFFMRIQHAFRASDEAESRMTTLLQENLSGARVVRAFARKDYEIAKFAQGNDQYRDRWYRLLALLSVYWSSSDLLCIGQTGAVLVAGAYYVAIGSITVGTLYAFTAYVGLFLWPARNMGRVLAELGKAMVAVGRIHEILEEPAESEPAEAVAVPQPQGHLVVRSLGFNHGQQAVLQDVCLDVPAGSTLGLLGPAGSGKSTLINLLLRLYDYDQGSITLDGVELRQLPRSLVRQRVGSVLQEPFLYSRTLRENIKLAHSHAGDPEMFEAAASADIHDSILTFESGYDTVVGERGVTLSGGQRQRVAIARALLRNPPVLILDDAMSAVDTQTEGVILRALRRRHGKMTTIVIAHRLTTLMHADMIAVLEGGRVTQSGSHQQLLREDGLYKRLWHVQTSMQRDLQQDLLTGGPLADAARRT